MAAWGAVGVGVAGLIGGAEASSSAQSAAQQAQQGAGYQSALAKQKNQARFEQAQAYLDPYIDRSEQAAQQMQIEMGLAPGEAGTAYMETPAYQAAISEGIGAINQGAAGAGILYSGRRGESLRDLGAGMQQNAYANYMNMLGNIASPRTAENLSALGVNQGLQSSAQQMAAQNQMSSYNLQGAAAQGAATADVFGGLTNLYSGYMAANPTQPTQPVQPAQSQFQGDINVPNQYSLYV